MTPSPFAGHRRGSCLCPGALGGWHSAQPPPQRSLSGDGGDRAAAAGACSRNGHGWAGTAAPRLRAPHGQEQLVRRLSLTGSPSGRRCPPRHKDPAAETSELITRVISDLCQHRGVSAGQELCCSGENPSLASPLGAGDGGHGTGTGTGTGTGSTVNAAQPGCGRLMHPHVYLGEHLLQMYIGAFFISSFFFLLLFIKVAKNLC